jgi:NhaP-type Na+/H+ or K+/H+ antiporter
LWRETKKSGDIQIDSFARLFSPFSFFIHQYSTSVSHLKDQSTLIIKMKFTIVAISALVAAVAAAPVPAAEAEAQRGL